MKLNIHPEIMNITAYYSVLNGNTRSTPGVLVACRRLCQAFRMSFDPKKAIQSKDRWLGTMRSWDVHSRHGATQQKWWVYISYGKYPNPRKWMMIWVGVALYDEKSQYESIITQY